ncbi:MULTISPECIES: ABC transporter permease [Halomonadaceae]|uniref:ABC transporter permease n=1 Tax=Halomonadaceae TaxID=28256 RepID=UPI0015984D49|nr:MULTISPECIES: ABC transporter permease [Halomonas]QJQ95545.1 ABC transporter permease [Halomonas sp. PA5]
MPPTLDATAAVAIEPIPAPAKGYWRAVFGRLQHDPVAMAAGIILLAILLAALLAPWISPSNPYATSMLNRLKPIGTPGFPLGSDELGRDVLSRLIHGARLSLLIGVMPVINAFVIGSSIGIVAGFVGGRTNTAIMRVIDVFYAFPAVLLAIALAGALGAGLVNSLFSLTVVFIPPIARVAESVTTQVRNFDYIEAARASGARSLTIIRRHVLGNVLGPIFVYATSLISVSMILASGLSFLGLGARPPMPEWGLMLNTMRDAIYVNPWVTVLPGAMIFTISICFNMLSDGLRSAMEVKL